MHNARLFVTTISTNSRLFILLQLYIFYSKPELQERGRERCKKTTLVCRSIHSHDNDHYGDTHPFDSVYTTLCTIFQVHANLQCVPSNNPFRRCGAHWARIPETPLLNCCCHHWYVERFRVHAHTSVVFRCRWPNDTTASFVHPIIYGNLWCIPVCFLWLGRYKFGFFLSIVDNSISLIALTKPPRVELFLRTSNCMLYAHKLTMKKQL